MTTELRFDVAISCTEEDSWIARDLHNLVRRSGFSVYCYLEQPDVIRGFMRPKLRDIYTDSSLNVLLWSHSYATRPTDSIPAMERRAIAARHVDRGDADSLLIIVVDDAKLERDFADVLAHKLQREGLTGIEGFIVQRLKALWSRPTQHGLLSHPPGTDKARGVLHPCKFTIDPAFEEDPLKRWKRLADVLVRADIPGNTKRLYLIPSGLTTPFLRHSGLLKTDPSLLKLKRDATRVFAKRSLALGQQLDGYWFALKKGELEIPTVYSPTYDAFLNQQLVTV